MYMDISDKYILISDGRSCFLYDNKGHFIREIGKQGRGPGEYTLINYVSMVNEKIYIHDIQTSDLIEYNINGTFEKRNKSGFTVKEKYQLDKAIIINDSMILGNIENRTGKEEYKAFIVDKKGIVKYYFKNYILFDLENGNKSVRVPGRAIFYRFGNKVFFKELLNDTLFQVDDNYRLTPVYVFDFGKYKHPLSDRGKNWNQKDLSSYINLIDIFPTGNFLFLKYDFNKFFPAKRLTPEILKTPGGEDYIQWHNLTGRGILGIYDKKQRDLLFSEPTSTNNQLYTTGLYNDVDAGPRFFPGMMVNDSTMVMDIQFNHFYKHIVSEDFKNNKPKYPEKKKRLEVLIDSLRKAEFDNPVLMFVTYNQ